MGVKLTDTRITREVELPSLPGSKVVIYSSLLFKDLDGTSRDGFQFGLQSLPKLIKSWNLCDENDKELEINVENVQKLPLPVAQFLLDNIMNLATEQKKSWNLPSTSAPS